MRELGGTSRGIAIGGRVTIGGHVTVSGGVVAGR